MLEAHRVLIVHDRPPLLAVLRRLVAEKGFEVVGTARSGAEALRLLGVRPADAVVVDLEGTEQEQLELVRGLRAAHPEVAIVVVSDAAAASAIESALEEGASAYVLRGASPEDVVTAIRQAFSRSLFLGADVLERRRNGSRSAATRRSGSSRT